MYSLLKGRAEGLEERMISFAGNLVRIPSSSLGEGRAAELIKREMTALGYEKVFIDEAGNVVGILFGRELQPTLLLNCHIDTVSPDSQDDWKFPAYGGIIEDGRLHGVGSADCKAGLAAQIYAGALLKHSLLPLRGNIVVAATVAEENGRSIGIKHLISETLPALGCRPDFAVLGEPTELGLYFGHDGWVEMNIHIEGTNPFHVDDAARRMSDDLRKIYFERSNDPMPDSDHYEEMTVRNPKFNNREGFREADIKISKRLRNNETADSVAGWLGHHASIFAKTATATAVSVDVVEARQKLYTGKKTIVKHITNAWMTDPYSAIICRARQALDAAGCEVRMGKWNLGRLGMGTAGSVLTNEFKIPTIGYGPGDENQAHSVDESVEIGKVCTAVYGTASIAHSLVGIPVSGWTSDDI